MDASLWVAKTGLNAQQTRMGVISNNLANVNTNGFKRDRAVFKLVTDLCNGCPKDEVASLTIEDFLPLGVKELLTMQRQNGLGSLIERIVTIANTK